MGNPEPSKANPAKGWKQFTLKDGTTRELPAWANEPLGFRIPPDEALNSARLVQPPDKWKRARRKARKSGK
jgi:hypothetical protein